MAGDARGAVEQLEEALRLSPEFARAHFSLGVILASSGRYPSAIERFESAVKLEPDYLEARLGWPIRCAEPDGRRRRFASTKRF